MGLDGSFDEFVWKPPAEIADIEAAEKQLGKALPADFKALLLEHDGGEGFIGEHYLVLWNAANLAAYNQDYEVEQYAPGLIAFGSDGGGEGFAFDTHAEPYPVVMMPFIGMSLADSIRVADSFTELLQRMKTVAGSLF